MKKLETEADKMNRIYKENGLVREDIHQDQRGFKFIKRAGIEKIIAKHNIQMQLDLKVCNLGLENTEDHVVVMATGKKGDNIVQSFGSANDKTCSPFQKGIKVEMAEKRAKARVVLQLVDLYSEGIHSEDEFPEVKPVNSIKS